MELANFKKIFSKYGNVDTLILNQYLKEVNFSSEQAALVTQIVKETQENSLSKHEALEKLATKRDLAKLEASTKESIAKLDNNITKLELKISEKMHKQTVILGGLQVSSTIALISLILNSS